MESGQQTQRNLRNIEAIDAMGMLSRLRVRWLRRHNAMLVMQGKASSKATLISGIARLYRTLIQSLVLGLGVYLVIEKEISPGGMMAGSMLMGRALQPLDLLMVLLAVWKSC
jgi:ATP-binding cassette subfamily C protein EexD